MSLFAFGKENTNFFLAITNVDINFKVTGACDVSPFAVYPHSCRFSSVKGKHHLILRPVGKPVSTGNFHTQNSKIPKSKSHSLKFSWNSNFKSP